ncbi:MAG: UDP-N-acetylglucosamine--N-acetylmuramyl-(pentapeptide) pyrophosphoryl-undecaprenol N-acetylglucosamine transferase [Candidatus Chromulinivorax sp.]
MATLTTQAALILCFVAGKSGGHLLPCITKAEKILQEQSSSQVYLFSAGSTLDHKIMAQHPKINHYVPAKLESIPYRQPWLFPLFCFEFGAYFINSLYKLWSIQPTKIISFGGLNSIPVCLAGKLLGIPFDLYELNVQPGKTVQFLSYFTNTVYICFQKTAEYLNPKKCALTDYPVRFTKQDTIYNKEQLLEQNNLQNNRKTILILGGSQGSIFINQAIRKTIEENHDLATKIQIIHQIGIYDQDNYQKFYQELNIPAVIFTYNEQLQNFYNLADLIICRAGAGTLFEVAFFKKPCIIIPLQTELNDHQVENAYAIQEMYPLQFSVLLQENCINNLTNQIKNYIF